MSVLMLKAHPPLFYVGKKNVGAHYLGGKLAHFFGVTSPDWQFAIDLHEEMEREAMEEKEAEERALRHLQEYGTNFSDTLTLSLSLCRRRTRALRDMESQTPQ